jgi:hypothetical protein
MKLPKFVPLCLGVVVLAGCATRSSVEEDKVTNSFASRLTPGQLARCMVRSIDGRILGSMKGSIEAVDPAVLEVIVRNGDNVWAVAKVRAEASGSKAEIFYGGSGKFDIVESRKWLTEGCS